MKYWFNANELDFARRYFLTIAEKQTNRKSKLHLYKIAKKFIGQSREVDLKHSEKIFVQSLLTHASDRLEVLAVEDDETMDKVTKTKMIFHGIMEKLKRCTSR